MLLLSDASLIVFIKFLQIFLWISIPALFIGMLITTFIHYRDKKRKQKKLDQSLIFENDGSYDGDDDISLMPSNLYLPGDKQEAKKIIRYLSHSNARYIAIRKDFEILS